MQTDILFAGLNLENNCSGKKHQIGRCFIDDGLKK